MSLLANVIENINNIIVYITQMLNHIDMKYVMIFSLVIAIYILLDPFLFLREDTKNDQK